MFTTKSTHPITNDPTSLTNPAIEPLPNVLPPVVREAEDVAASVVEEAAAHLPGKSQVAAELWKRLPQEEQGVLAHIAKSAEALCTPEHLAELGKTVQAIGSLLTKGLIARTPLGALNILDPLLKDIAGDSSMHLEASGSVTEGGPKTFQFNFGVTTNVRKLQATH